MKQGEQMYQSKVYECKCENCNNTDVHPDQELHYQMNLFLSRLDEQQKRWYVALEVKKIGHGGMKHMSQITGMHINTIRRGRQELESGLVNRPIGSARLPGGGRPIVEKKFKNRKGPRIISRR